MKARLIRRVGVRSELRVYWDRAIVSSVAPCDQCPEGHPRYDYQNTCPNAYGRGHSGGHNATAVIRDYLFPEAVPESFGEEGDFPEEAWPTKCDHCGAPVPPSSTPSEVGQSGEIVNRQVSSSKLFDTPSGRPEPGDVYWSDSHEPGHCWAWDNCDGRHLRGVTPNGVDWDVCGRASNCTMREEKTHRCWVISGSPEDGTLHVGKGGHTCAAGAGSIAVDGWHGFLHGMSWNQC